MATLNPPIHVDKYKPFLQAKTNTQDQNTMVEFKRAIRSMREQSIANGNSGMSLEEINEEINAARLAKKAD